MKYPRGWFSSWDISTYRALVGSLPHGARIAEVGPFVGRSICSVETLLKELDAKVLLVDAFCGDARPEQLDANSARELNTVPGLRAELESNLEHYGIADRCTVITAWSEDGAEIVPDGSLDFIFIDTEHSYESVARDVGAWAPKLRAGGTIAGHDYKKHGSSRDGSSMYEDMRRGLYETFGEDSVYKLPAGGQQSTIWVVTDEAVLSRLAHGESC